MEIKLKVGDIVRFRDIPDNGNCYELVKLPPASFMTITALYQDNEDSGSVRVGDTNGKPLGDSGDIREGGAPFFTWRFERAAFMLDVMAAIEGDK